MSGNIFRIAVRKFDPFEKAIQLFWENFCRETGCMLQLEMVPMDLHPLYHSILKDGGLQNGQWDVAHINTDWLAEAVEKGALEELSAWIGASPPENFPNGWSASLLGMQRFENRVYGLPFHNGPECFIYRKDLFESEEEQKAFAALYGKRLVVPQTWDDLMEVAAFFNRPEQGLYGTAFAGFPDGHNTVFDFCLQVWTRGGDILDAQNRVQLYSPQAVEGMQFYREALRNTRAIHPESPVFDSVQLGMAFANGNVAMMVNWFGFASMSDVYEKSNVKGKVDIANVPMGMGGEPVSLNAYWMYSLGSGSVHKQTAYDFIRYATTAQNDKLLTLCGGIGCRKSTWSDDEINSMVPYYHKLDILHRNAKSLPRMANWSSIADVVDALVLEVMNSDKDIETLLIQAQQKVDVLLR